MQKLIQAIILFAALFPAQAAVTLAIVPKPEMPSEPVFLLTAAFAKLPDVTLVERAEFDRILGERGLSATSGKDVLQAAEILGADAVMFLESSGTATNQVITSRLAVVSKGAIIHANRAPFSSAWTATMFREFGPVIPKTILPPDRAIKLSFLNLRSPGDAAASEGLDRELTSLLLLRLSIEPQVIVLERRKIRDLAFEKELQQSSEQFWTGSHLVDGTVNPNGINLNVVDLSIRLQTLGSPPQQILLQGARTNLVGLIDRLAVTLLQKVNAKPTRSWDAAAEASQHFEEAEWALRWRMYEEAQAAADSAWALGFQTPQSAAVRSLAYARGALPTDCQWINYVGPTLFGSTPTVEPAPRPGELQSLRVALAVTEEALNQHSSWLTNQQWSSAVNETLAAAGETLDRYYWFPNSRRNEYLPEVRLYARSILKSALNDPQMHRRFWFTNNPPSASELDAFYKGPNVFESAVTYSGVFNDTPEAALAAYRDLMTGSAFPYVRKFLFGRHSKDPRLAAWQPSDQGRLNNLWTEFVGEMLASTNAMLQIEGRYFSLELLPDLPALQKEVHAFLGATTKDTNGLSLYQIPPRFVDSAYNLDHSRTWPNDKIGSGEVTLINNAREFFKGIDDRYSFLKMQRARAQLEKQFKDHIAAAKPYDSTLFSEYLLGIRNREQARAATNDVAAYLAIVTNTPSGLNATAAAEVAAQIAALENVIARPTPQERINEARTRRQASAARARTNQSAPRSPTLSPNPDTNTFVIRLTADDFWQFPSDNLLTAPFSSEAHPPIYRDGKLWFLTHEGFWRMNQDEHFRNRSFRPIVVNVDTSTLKTNLYPAATKADDYYTGDLMAMIKADRRRFTYESIHPFLFLAEKAQLRRLDTRTREWREFTLPVAEGTLYRVRDRLILSAESGIFELLDNGERSRVLASVRRRPAMTALDSLETFGTPPPILPGPNNSVRTLINGNAYRFENGDWEAETHFTNLATVVQSDSILFHGGPFAELHLLTPTNTAALFIGTGPLRGPKGAQLSSKRSQALFDLPEQFTGDRVFTIVDGYAAIWEPWVKDQFTTVPANLLMTVFDPAEPRPLSFPVAFDTTLPSNQGTRGNFLLSRLWMAQSDEGFLLGLPGNTGFWRISRDNLNRAFAQARRGITK
jgi:hypothetical protein